MFDLEQSIAEWRRQMLAGGVKSPEVLDELEAHLREDFAGQIKAGTAATDAFEKAVERIGQPNPLRKEFSKVGPNWLLRRQKLKRALLRLIGFHAPVPFLKTWTPGAQEVLALGSQEARGFHHDFVGTEHLLLGVLRLETEGVNGVLRKLGLNPQIVRSKIEKFVGTGPVQPADRLPHYTPRAKRALNLATEEAVGQNRTSVDAEHIFLGLLREGGGVAALVLKDLGVNVQAARGEILRNLGPKPDTGAQ